MSSVDFIFPESKKRYIRNPSKIISTASYFPRTELSNSEIISSAKISVTDKVIRKTLGVERRRVADDGMADSDLLLKAAQLCLKKADIQPDQLSKILVTKFIGDRILPMTAAMVQRKLNCSVTMHAVDVEGGINAFLQSLDLATRYISTTAQADQYILILSGGIQRLPVSKTDPRLAFLFGDGAGAVLLAAADQQHFLASYIYSNPHLFETAGSRSLKMEQWFSDKIYQENDYSLLYNLYQMGNWKDSAGFYLEAAQVIRDRLLQESGLEMGDLDLVLVTENNKKLRDLTLDKLHVPAEKSLSIIADYGNTMSAMLPLLLDRAFEDGKLNPGTTVMLISHGEGASGGGIVYRV